jgi:hypothetical protein
LGDESQTASAVTDYLKIYFPAYKYVLYLGVTVTHIQLATAPTYQALHWHARRPDLEEGTSRVWLLGEKDGRAVRCFACHKRFREYNKAKLRSHLLHRGKQAKCPAISNHIATLLQNILAEEGFNPDGTTRNPADDARPALPPPRDGQEPAPLPATNGGDDDGAPAAPTLPASANGDGDGPPASTSSAPPLPASNADHHVSSSVPTSTAVSLPASNADHDPSSVPTSTAAPFADDNNADHDTSASST